MKEEYEKLNPKLQLTIEYNSQNREKIKLKFEGGKTWGQQ